ncbi:hypothetical protein KJ742_05490 [Patescibacteria group bacterium]|nr:hypothetical protein [Patescibacteria group bacterium]MBU1683371.1 hypothetical protein [Patescibacteria group bacterium]
MTQQVDSHDPDRSEAAAKRPVAPNTVDLVRQRIASLLEELSSCDRRDSGEYAALFGNQNDDGQAVRISEACGMNQNTQLKIDHYALLARLLEAHLSEDEDVEEVSQNRGLRPNDRFAFSHNVQSDFDTLIAALSEEQLEEILRDLNRIPAAARLFISESLSR